MEIDSCVALVLAGGRGTRLKTLTDTIPKPLVSFGGKYRLIDFSLSNCIHAGIKNIGILTQHLKEPLHNYITCFKNRQSKHISDIRPLPSGAEGYCGTADAVFQNLDYLDSLNPQYVFILSGDHVYNMDYSKMLEYHIEKGADVTIASTYVPWEDTSRFGILSVEEGGRVLRFEEKPRNSFGNLASMGVYLFNYRALKTCLVNDHYYRWSHHDFGRDILPELALYYNTYSYLFSDYWRDVGTADCLWNANMDLLHEENRRAILPSHRRIYSGEDWTGRPIIKGNGTLDNTIVSGYSFIAGKVSNSILGFCSIGVDSRVTNSIIMPGACVGNNVTLHKAIVLEGTYIDSDTIINGEVNPCYDGAPYHYTDTGIAIVGDSLRCILPRSEQGTNNNPFYA